MTGITTLYGTGLTFGGPISMIYGWLVAGLFTLMVGLSMSEICSAYPTAAGLYFWSAKLCGNDWGPFASWLTGWYVLSSSLLFIPIIVIVVIIIDSYYSVCF
ncbi:putative amino acid/polyamine transporter I [Helianthus annuus]|nr:putative amino acid/polyamine transporter I [Helianthus annuus]KAJ0632560.1 putative amino acid/polyamine transporter I [Helianthus annuus]